jgi:hypothetical protein
MVRRKGEVSLHMGLAGVRTTERILFIFRIYEFIRHMSGLNFSILWRIYTTIILPVVLHGCEIWLTLREEHRLRVFKRDEMTDWRKLHNEELHNLYSSPSIIRMIKSRKMRLPGYVARMGRRGMHVRYW